MRLSIIILLAIISGILIPFLMNLYSRLPFFRKNGWYLIIGASLSGLLTWLILLIICRAIPKAGAYWQADLLCGFLVWLCASWCNYWLCNFGGGFRINMLVDLARQKEPITIEEWMSSFNHLGMEAFFKDRIESILLPFKVIEIEGEQVRLTNSWGRFFGTCASILRFRLER